ncbi:MAG TPA: DUF983 domain-containing protein [Chthoniobacterales bacterium]|nr:DUF983 domain-containing protein [Chthoniobacterales bacterium]
MTASQSDLSDYSVGRFLRMMGNALRWRCPTCGERPLFVPWYNVRSLRDWFEPLDGCPKCGYPFEREPGYFLLSIFAINYGVAAILGMIVYLILDFWVRLSIGVTLLLTIIPIPLFNFWFARHSKALFLAFDLFFDPHHRDNDDGDQPVKPPDQVPKDPHPKPVRR